MKLIVAALLLLTSASAFAQDWVSPMQAVHASFKGTHNTYGRWGDSITSTGAFYLGGNPSNVGAEAAPALAWYNSSGEVGLGAYGTGNPAKSGSESSYALLIHDAANNPTQRNIDYWLATDKVEIAIILWGTNDCNKLVTTPAMYQANMTEIVRTCKANGTIPIITTPPPTHANDITPYVNAIWAVAAAEHVPTIDFYGQILSRNPGTSWDGLPVYNANPGAYSDTYQVPTLIGGDGIHPSNPGAYTNNYGADALSKCGYDLRNYLSTLALYDVYQKAVVATPEPASLSLLGLGALALLRKRKAQ